MLVLVVVLLATFLDPLTAIPAAVGGWQCRDRTSLFFLNATLVAMIFGAGSALGASPPTMILHAISVAIWSVAMYVAAKRRRSHTKAPEASPEKAN